MTKIKFFVDAAPLVEPKPSGIAHSIAGLVEALMAIKDFSVKFDVVLIIPRGRKAMLKNWPFTNRCQVKELPFKTRIINGLVKYRLLPAMDLLLGKGIYLFGNYRNWPLTKGSFSYTYIFDISFVLYPQFVQPRNQKMLLKKVPQFIKQADIIVTGSETIKKEIADYYHLPSDSIVIMHSGFSSEMFHPHPKSDVDKIKRRYNIKGSYIIFVGNIEPRKNLEGLIEAYELLDEELQARYALVIIGGDGWLNENINKKIQGAIKSGKQLIKPSNYVPDGDLALLISGADLLVQPAFYEGFGMPPIEAMASDIPVTASGIPVLKEILGNAAVYFDPANPADIRDAIERVLTDKSLRQQLISKGRERRKLYTWQKTADKFYKDLVTRLEDL